MCVGDINLILIIVRSWWVEGWITQQKDE